MRIKFIFSLIFCQVLFFDTISQDFAEVGLHIGIEDSYRTTDGGSSIFGGGLSFADFDQDGFDDLSYATHKDFDIAFYRNNNGSFNKVEFEGIENNLEGKQILWVDYDNDGDKDLLYSTWENYVYLYQNQGDFTFLDVTEEAGLTKDLQPSYGCNFVDFDNDGLLDLYVCTYVSPINSNFIYKNQGDGTFVDVTPPGPIFPEPSTINGAPFAFCAAFFDYDGNLTPDCVVARDRKITPNAFYHNDDGDFISVSAFTGADIYISAMSTTIGDYDNDLDLDIYCTNDNTSDSTGSVLLQNTEGFFANTAIESGVNFSGISGTDTEFRVSWGANFLDYDNDLDLDLYVSSELTGVEHRNAFFVNQGDGTFIEPLAEGLPGDTVASFANAIGDFNNDGLLDIAAANQIENHHIWMNETEDKRNWLKVKVEGVVGNKDGVGTWIQVQMDSIKRVRYTHCGQAFLAQNSDYHHFGIGDFTTIDTLKISWQSGIIDLFTDIDANQVLYIKEGSSDQDSDGYYSFEDCDDFNSNINPGVAEINNNDIDENCDGLAVVIDNDGDGFNSDDDCNDNVASINPGVEEIINNDIDENCDGIAVVIDNDGDGFNSDVDCNDNIAEINPGVEEIVNNDIDENCDGIISVIDNDGDGYNSDVDCNDNIAEINPGVEEIINNDIDENCDGFAVVIDNDGDGYNSDIDCNDDITEINPGVEEIINNDIDENCDGIVVIVDNDGDGFNSSDDCDDSDPDINPEAQEIENNEIDENCDGVMLVIDNDGDGYNSNQDCDDNNAYINPGVEEIPDNEVDEDCDGVASITSAVIEDSKTSEPSIIPNPSSDKIRLKVECNQCPYYIYNHETRIVMEGTYEVGSNIDIRELAAGIYFIILNDGESLRTLKFCKI